MRVIYTDGSVLNCESIEICGSDLICDDYRIIPICYIERIESI